VSHVDLQKSSVEDDLTKDMPTLLGIPLDVNSSYLRGPAGAPVKIREALQSDASNKWSELGVDVGAADAFGDAGDLQLSNSSQRVE
jgi:arginase